MQLRLDLSPRADQGSNVEAKGFAYCASRTQKNYVSDFDTNCINLNNAIHKLLTPQDCLICSLPTKARPRPRVSLSLSVHLLGHVPAFLLGAGTVLHQETLGQGPLDNIIRRWPKFFLPYAQTVWQLPTRIPAVNLTLYAVYAKYGTNMYSLSRGLSPRLWGQALLCYVTGILEDCQHDSNPCFTDPDSVWDCSIKFHYEKK